MADLKDADPKHPMEDAAKYALLQKVYRNKSKTKTAYIIDFTNATPEGQTAQECFAATKEFLQNEAIEGLNHHKIYFHDLSVEIRGRHNQQIFLNWLADNKIRFTLRGNELPQPAIKSEPFSLVDDYEELAEGPFSWPKWSGITKDGDPVLEADFCEYPGMIPRALKEMEKLGEYLTKRGQPLNWKKISLPEPSEDDYPLETRIRISGRKNCEAVINWIGKHNPGLSQMFAQESSRMFADSRALAKMAWDAFEANSVDVVHEATQGALEGMPMSESMRKGSEKRKKAKRR